MPLADEPISRSAALLRVLRRTVIGRSDDQVLLARLAAEVQPSSEDIIDALIEVTSLSNADPSKQRLMDVLAMALEARRAEDAKRPAVDPRELP